MADEYVVIGPARADQSYLDPERILNAARQTGATLIHPGYGFLSENAEFARTVTEAGLIFVGPDAQTIRKMGDKSEARQTAQQAGVPVVPGSDGEISSLDEACRAAEQIGYPLLIKASAGGGGRGIRIAASPDELSREFQIAQTEARAAFGSGAVYLERFISQARHIEVQILGDGEHAIHLYERECSLQRRRQKVFEEAPSPALSAAQRETLCHSAVTLAQSLGYKGAGTLEFLFDETTGEFFFIEMNTRIQVEHPVTEMVTGVDLVQWMIRIALGEPLTLQQASVPLKGSAIEMRINAEDPAKNFFPSPGTVGAIHWPEGDGIRVESHLYPDYQIPPYYDSLLAKLVVYGESRQQAFERAIQALENTVLSGMATTMPLHHLLLQDPDVQAGRFDTGMLETWLEANLSLLSTEGTAHG